LWTSRKREWERIDSLERARYFVGLDAIATPCRVHALTFESSPRTGNRNSTDDRFKSIMRLAQLRSQILSS
jgi:hypothetical protein